MVQLTSSSTETEILDQLTEWQNALKKKDAAEWPSAGDIERLHERLDALAQDAPDKAREYQNALASIRTTLALRRRQQIKDILERLRGMRGEQDEWQARVSKADEALRELEHLIGSQEKTLRGALDEEQQRLEGEALLMQAQQAWEQGRKSIEQKKKVEETSTLVEDANRLAEEMRMYYAEAQSARAPADFQRQLQQLVKQAENYYQALRRVYEGAVTADMNEKYDEALIHLQKAREEAAKGEQLQVWYFATEDLSSDARAPMPIDEAIEIAKMRRRTYLIQQARKHITKIRQYLEEGQPLLAQEESESIVGREHLPKPEEHRVSQELAGLEKRIAAQLKAWREFEEAIRQASVITDKEEAWRTLDELGQQEAYRLFTRTNPLWKQTREELARVITNAVEKELAQCARQIADSEWSQARADCLRIKARYEAWPDAFAKILTTVNIFIELADNLERYLNQARQDLEAKHLESASKILEQVKDWIHAAQRQVPLNAGQYLRPQIELRQLQDILDVYQKAGELHRRLQTRVNETTRVKELESLVQEIQGHVDRVDERYREDFQALLALATARYHFYMGKSILNVAGNPEEAKWHLEQAAHHEAFLDKAQEAIVDIDRRLIPANRRVQGALENIKKFREYGRFWEAYQEAQNVTEEPAEKALKAKLREQLESVERLARQESETILASALDRHTGDPETLREHIRRIHILDPAYPKENIQRVWLLIHRLEAVQAMEKKRWAEAIKALDHALGQLKQLKPMFISDDLTNQEKDIERQRLAAQKEYMLQLATTLPSPESALIELEPMRPAFSDDPDVLLHLAEVRLKDVRRREDDFENTLSDDFIQKERELLQELAKSLNMAKNELETAENLGHLWKLQSPPPYEHERLRILGIDPNVWEQKRLAQLKHIGQRMSSMRLVHDKKYEIIHILQEIEAFIK